MMSIAVLEGPKKGMEWTEIELSGVQPLHFKGKRVGTVGRRETRDRVDGLALRFDTGAHVELRAAADVSEQLSCPRVFVIEGRSPDTFLLFGGERMYWLSTGGAVKSELVTFRKWGDEEYWVTDIIQQQAAVVIIYELGVLMIDEALQVRWHQSKYFNDDLAAVEGGALKFSRDGQEEWFIRLEDGSVSPQGMARPLRHTS
jgi:hypothetical protein